MGNPIIIVSASISLNSSRVPLGEEGADLAEGLLPHLNSRKIVHHCLEEIIMLSNHLVEDCLEEEIIMPRQDLEGPLALAVKINRPGSEEAIMPALALVGAVEASTSIATIMHPQAFQIIKETLEGCLVKTNLLVEEASLVANLNPNQQLPYHSGSNLRTTTSSASKIRTLAVVCLEILRTTTRQP